MRNIVFENNTDLDIDISLAQSIANDIIPNKELELLLTTNDEIHEINLSSRGIDKPTDVLSFPYIDMPHAPIGSIVISVDFVKAKAKEFHHSIEDEFHLLFIHGLLHIIGYDHEVDNGEHRAREEELIKKYKLPNSLIVRTLD